MYFQTQAELRQLRDIRLQLLRYWEVEEQLKRSPHDVGHQEAYGEVRERVAKAIPRLSRIAARHGAYHHLVVTSPPAFGSRTTRIDVFRCVLLGSPWDAVTRQDILDHVDEAIGACEETLQSDMWALINPFHWLRSLLLTVIRLPFILVSASGFDVAKVEEHLFGRLFKLMEIAALVYLAIKWGFDTTTLFESVAGVVTQ